MLLRALTVRLPLLGCVDSGDADLVLLPVAALGSRMKIARHEQLWQGQIQDVTWKVT